MERLFSQKKLRVKLSFSIKARVFKITQCHQGSWEMHFIGKHGQKSQGPTDLSGWGCICLSIP
jgi:hypothetical protein